VSKNLRYVAPAGLMTLGGLAMNAAPALISTMMDGWHLNEAIAGGIVGAEILASAIVIPLAVRVLAGRRLRRIAVTAAFVLAIVQLATGAADGIVELALSRVASGAVCGVLWALFSIMLAAQEDPDKVYGVGLAFFGIFYAVILWLLLGVVVSHWGVVGFYTCLAAVILLVSFCFAAIPAQSRAREAPSATSKLQESRTRSRAPATLVVAAGLFNLGTVCSYYFSPRIGGLLHLDAESIGLWLGFGNAALVIGALVVTKIEARIRRTSGLGVSMIGNAISAVVLLIASDKWGFYAGIIGYNVFNGIFFPFISGAAAAMDRGGRVVGWLNSVTLFTIGIAPVIGGLIVSASSYRMLALFAAPLLVASIPMAFLAGRGFDQKMLCDEEGAVIKQSQNDRGSSA
jgi:predicted MFS family arabinose efflux permease